MNSTYTLDNTETSARVTRFSLSAADVLWLVIAQLNDRLVDFLNTVLLNSIKKKQT